MWPVPLNDTIWHQVVGLEAALDRFSEIADDRRFGIEGMQVMLDQGRRAERRWTTRAGNSYVLGRIVASVSGLDLREFLLPRLFGPLDIRNPQWSRCPLGFPLGAIGLQLRTGEIARVVRSSCTEESATVSASCPATTSHG